MYYKFLAYLAYFSISSNFYKQNSNSDTIQMESKLDKYWRYLKLTEEQRKLRIQYAQQMKEHLPNPQGNHVFPIKNFIDFEVLNEHGKLIKLVTFRYPAEGQTKAQVIMFHGLNSHIGHGAHIAHQFSKHGIQTIGFDHRGFGQSEGTPGYVKDLNTHIEDCLKFVAKIRQLYPELPKFVLGLSMGGLASYYVSSMHPDYFKGAILMAPALKNQVSGALVGMTKFLKKVLPENMKLMKPIYGKASKNPTITDFVKEDPYAFKGRSCLSTLSFLTKTMDTSPDTFKNYTCPFLVIQGGLDKLVNPMVAFQLFNSSPLPQKDKDILFYKNMWHDIWHEPQIFEIIENIIKWIDKRLLI